MAVIDFNNNHQHHIHGGVSRESSAQYQCHHQHQLGCLLPRITPLIDSTGLNWRDLPDYFNGNVRGLVFFSSICRNSQGCCECSHLEGGNQTQTTEPEKFGARAREFFRPQRCRHARESCRARRTVRFDAHFARKQRKTHRPVSDRQTDRPPAPESRRKFDDAEQFDFLYFKNN